ncbi:MAG: YbhN family protein [Dehalococcoidia bacterium]
MTLQFLRRPLVRAALIGLVLCCFLAVVLRFVLPQVGLLTSSSRVLEEMTWWVVLLAVLAQVLCYVCHGYVIRGLQAAFGEKLEFLRGVAIVMASYSLSMIWGGQLTNSAATYRWLRRGGETGEAAVLTGIILPLLNTVSFALFSAIGLVFLLAYGELSTVLVVLFGIALLLVLSALGITWWLMRHRAEMVVALDVLSRQWARFRRRTYEPESSREAISRLTTALDHFFVGRWQRAVLGDFLSAACDFATLYILFFAAGYTMSPGVALAGYGLPLLAGKLSILPGGLGVIEGGMAALYLSLGVPGEVVVVVVIGYRLLSFWIPVLLGFPLAIVLDRGLLIATTPPPAGSAPE